MANRLQLRKGTTAQNTAFTGAIGELTYDTQKKQLRVHDGSTVGGKVIDDPTRDVTSQVSNATEALAGKAKIATTAIAQAGVNDTDIITAKKLRGALNASGTAPISACRAWANLDTTTTPPTIRSSMNVSSVVEHSVGDYTVNFSVGLNRSDYALLGTASNKSGIGGILVGANNLSVANPQTTSSVRIYVCNDAGAFTTSSFVSIGVFC